MRRTSWITLLVFGLCAALLATPASAWEFKMKGEVEWVYRYWTRTGSMDIFGQTDPYFVNLGINHLRTYRTGGTQNAPAAGFGVLAGENNFGSDMSLVEYRGTLYPVIKINKAIKVAASVNLTSLGIWSAGEPWTPAQANRGFVNTMYAPLYTRPAAANVPNTFVTLQWLKTSIKTPMLDFSIGYKTSGLGMGLWKHKSTRSSASFSVKAKYGPLSIGLSPYFARRNSEWRSRNLRNEGDRAQRRKERIRNYFRALMFGISYKCGPIAAQLVSDSYLEERSPDTDARGAAITPGVPNDDTIRYRFHASLKYFNGRQFFNIEGNWFNRWRSGSGAATIPNGPVNEGIDNNGMIYGVEAGFVAGPGKFTANYVRATGNDIATRETDEDARSGDAGVSAGYMQDWGYLMYHLYGTGTNFNADGYGQPTDFHHIGVKVDRAIAANLNFWALGAYAWRDTPQAWTLGGDYELAIRRFDNDDLRNWRNGASTFQPVPDSAMDIGWEVNAGFDWKLLEHLTWSTLFAYWKPGNWWAYATPNTSAVYRINGPAATNIATVQGDNAGSKARALTGVGRDIDALFAVETKLLINF